MSNIYIQEPPTSGKVLLHTTIGDIDIELWSKEAPKACRNFVQLCLEKYYDGTIFHRVIKGFIAQGGDPKGDGTGGESIYGAPFKDEFHSRLRFVRRGLVAMANGGKNDNGSQFFFTLGPCPELQNKHTVFGKVTGDTLYNMLKLEDCLVDKNDRPVYPHKIVSTKVLLNPFTDIVPRTKEMAICMQAEIELKPNAVIMKNYKLLSFGEEAEAEENEVDSVAQMFRGKSKSSHDLANDPKLSSVSVMSLYENNTDNSQPLENIRKKLKPPDDTGIEKMKMSSNNKGEELPSHTDNKEEELRRELIRQEIKELKKDLRKKKVPINEEFNGNTNSGKQEEMDNSCNPLLSEFHHQSVVYRNKAKQIPSDQEERERKTMELLSSFQEKLQRAKTNVEEHSSSAEDEDEGSNWLAHELHFEEGIKVAKDANLPLPDRYDITDPRNPINQRRRTESKKKLPSYKHF